MANYETVIDLMNDRERMKRDRDALMAMVRDLVTILDGAQSGFIGGCGSGIEAANRLLDDVGGASGD